MTNTIDEGFIKGIVKVAFPSVEYHQVIYILRNTKNPGIKQRPLFKKPSANILNDYVKIRLLCGSSIEQVSNLNKSTCCCFGSKKKGFKSYFKKIVVHIHGGGFVGMSSFSH
jgi:hypothetical protein